MFKSYAIHLLNPEILPKRTDPCPNMLNLNLGRNLK